MSQQRLERLKIRQAQLSAKIQALESREKARARKQDTRRKILVGAYFLGEMKSERWDELCGLMDGFLVRDSDRVLFGLTTRAKGREPAGQGAEDSAEAP